MLGKCTNRVASIAFAMLLVMSMAAVTPTTAAAANNSFIDSFGDDQSDNSRLDEVREVAGTIPDFVSGVFDRVTYITSKQNPFSNEGETTAVSEARDVQ